MKHRPRTATRLDAVTEKQAVQLRVALAQVDTSVGNLTGNSELVVRWTGRRPTPARTWCSSPR